MKRLALVALCLTCGGLGCGGPPTDETPSGALRLFFEATQRAQETVGEDRDEALDAAFDLLDEASRDRLEDRARAAEALGARDHRGYEMLAAYPNRDEASAVPPRASAFRESIDDSGLHATVTVRLPAGEAEVSMVREEDGWRVMLDVPEEGE